MPATNGFICKCHLITKLPFSSANASISMQGVSSVCEPRLRRVFACGLYASQFVVWSPERRSSDHPPAPTITAFEVPTLLQALVKLGNSPHRESEGRRWIRQPHITTRQEQYCKYDTSQSRYFSRYRSKLCHSNSLFDKLISQPHSSLPLRSNYS